MSQSQRPPAEATGNVEPTDDVHAPQQHRWSDAFALPRPLRELFQRFPLRTYPANHLPTRSLRHGSQHALYLFTTADGARNNAPSYNPSCLKWQTYLKICGVDFVTISSTNHASPSGVLPFLLPRDSTARMEGSPSSIPAPVPSSKIRRWVEDRSEKGSKFKRSLSEEVHYALVDHRLRRAWLYLLYLNPDNAAIVQRLYVKPFSHSWLINAVTASQLRRAAEEELRKSNAVVTVTKDELQVEGEDALAALSDLLGSQDWFFGAEKPGLFDASVFAYTHLLLDNDGMGWSERPFKIAFERNGRNLVQHRNRLKDLYYAL